MTLATVYTRAALGIQAPEVRIEAHIGNGLPGFTLVGLPETAVREAKDRVRCAMLNSGFQFPPKRITLNLAPADLPKEGGVTICRWRWRCCWRPGSWPRTYPFATTSLLESWPCPAICARSRGATRRAERRPREAYPDSAQ